MLPGIPSRLCTTQATGNMILQSLTDPTSLAGNLVWYIWADTSLRSACRACDRLEITDQAPEYLAFAVAVL
jgi:hypothetical protein